MNRKLFIKYSAVLGGMAALKPSFVFADAYPHHKKNILCIWGDGVNIADFKNHIIQLPSHPHLKSSHQFDQYYTGSLHSHTDATELLTQGNKVHQHINVLHESFDPKLLDGQELYIIRFTGCDAAHYNMELYHTALKKYSEYTQQLNDYIYSHKLYNDYNLVISTEIGRDTHGGEMQNNCGLICSHHNTDEARKIGRVGLYR